MVQDEEVIARASGGLALCGTYVRESDEKMGRVRARKQLLCSPAQCKLMNSNQTLMLRSHSCSNIQASERFREEVKNSGWTVGLNLHANICGFGIEALGEVGPQKNKKTSASSQEMTNEACHMQIWYCPRGSFAISLHQMQLSRDALYDARRVQTSSDAEKFLLDYNSHVSTGKYHVGGVLMKGLVMRTKGTRSLQQMLEKVCRNTKLGARVDFGNFKLGGKADFSNEDESSSAEQRASQQATVEYVYTALGPRTDEEADFKAQLNSNSTWDIIDQDENPGLVPVWEIPAVKQAQDLRKFCELLREAWQNSVKAVAATQIKIYSLLQASYMENVKSLLDASSTSAGLEIPKDLTLKRVWIEMTEHLDATSKKDLFQLDTFDDLLRRLADTDNGRALVRDFITSVKDWLDTQEDIHLSSPIQALLERSEDVETVPLPPLEDMSPGGLVARLRTLLERPSPGTASASAVRAFDSDAVITAIRDFFRQNRNGGHPVAGVRSWIVLHGFDKNGEILDRKRVTEEELSVLVNELESTMATGYQNPSAIGITEGHDVVAGPGTHEGSGPRFVLADDIPGDIPSSVKTENLHSYSIGRNPPLFDQAERSSMPTAGGSVPEGIDTVYNRHMLVDRPKEISDDPRRRIMDRIRHRLEPFASPSGKPVAEVSRRKNFFPKLGTRVNESMSRAGSGKSHPGMSRSSPLGTLVQLLTSSDLLAQTALFQLLLDGRIAIPLVVPSQPEGNSSFGHLAEALNFVRVKLAKQEILSIAEDTKLPRVVFISNRQHYSKRETSHMACKVMNFQLPSKFFKGDTGDGMTVIELGVGFLRTSDDESDDHTPCLVFCVWGDHNRLGEFLAEVADFIIVETEPYQDARPLSWVTGQSKARTIFWRINPSDQGWENEPYSSFWGSFQQVADDIEEYLLQGIVEQKLFNGASAGGAATLQQCLTASIPPVSKETPVSHLANLDGIELEKAKESLKLQQNFADEAKLYFESLKKRRAKQEYDLRRLFLQNQRKELAIREKLPLLDTFIRILSVKNYVERSIGIVQLELNIEKKLHFILKRAYEKEVQAFEEFQRDEDNTVLKGNYQNARREHVEKKLGLEHLWRELSHKFVANTGLKHLPKLAAEHLLDGFPLEILDGDAGMFNSVWVESILSALNLVLSTSLKHKPKVFVLSVIGLQSSGKSTMLNVMFGTKLKTSAGQCTRGVYLQLIKSERKEFDYVLILDTEGIRSPEFFRDKKAQVQDNRLATFAVLPADACIVMVANEDDNGLKEVLPMVMLAFKESAMAEQCAGRRQAKVCFAYRSVDTNDLSKLKINQTKLQECLRSASKELGMVSIGERRESGSPGSSTSKDGVDTLLKGFRISTNEEESDVKYFGNLKKGNVPPGDTPDWEYGTKVQRLREYIHQRVTDDGWKAFDLKSWATHLKRVWDCIGEANFEISFRNQMEYFQFQALQKNLVAFRQRVGKKWMDEFEKMAGDLQVERGTVVELDPSFPPLWNKLRLTVQKTVDETAEEVKVVLEQPQWQEWKLDELKNWKTFCSDQERDLQQRLQDYVDAVFKFDNVVKDYNAKIQMEIDVKTRNIDMTSPNRQRNMKRDFDKIFQRILSEARRAHPPMADSVSTKVTRVYTEGQITGQRFDFPAESSDNKQEKKATRWSFGITAEKKHSPVHDHSRMQEVITSLESKVEVYLQDKKQYANHLVEEMIRATDRSNQEARLSKQEQHDVHCRVMDLVTAKLVTMQKKWDEDHNVSKRLEKEEERLWLFFQNRADQVDGTKLLFTEIDNLLKSKLMNSFRSNLSTHVSNKLMNDPWAGNWIVMRAHLDLHLVKLIDSSETSKLLQCVRAGAEHYKTIVDNLIQQEIDSQVKDGHFWVSFVEKIKQAVTAAALKGDIAESGSSKFSVFLKNLVQSINSIGAGSLELTSHISNYLSEKVYSNCGGVLDFVTLAKQVCRGLDTDTKPDLAASSIKAVVKLVTDRMIQCATDNAGPRCATACPHCTLTCFRPMGHSGHHDTLHQPSGLCGRFYVESMQLVHHSCSESVVADEKFKDSVSGINNWANYTDWNKHYPTWKVPTNGGVGTVHVREYIFAHYQEEIVSLYKTSTHQVKICSAMPPSFLLHEIGALRLQLESTVAAI